MFKKIRSLKKIDLGVDVNVYFESNIKKITISIKSEKYYYIKIFKSIPWCHNIWYKQKYMYIYI